MAVLNRLSYAGACGCTVAVLRLPGQVSQRAGHGTRHRLFMLAVSHMLLDQIMARAVSSASRTRGLKAEGRLKLALPVGMHAIQRM